ncbi:MAG: hypothetical protein JNM68_04290 [Dinghuibacter sp.]|nr:hypothetical protein [Dinghuibacter sp.]
MNDVLRPSEFELTIDNDSRRYLHDTAGWGKFLAITGIIFSVFMVVFGFYMAAQETRSRRLFESEEAQQAERLGTIIGFIIAAAIYIFPCIMLYRYSDKIRAALATNNQNDLNTAFRAQKTLYIYMGILAILGLLLMLLALVGLTMGTDKGR